MIVVSPRDPCLDLPHSYQFVLKQNSISVKLLGFYSVCRLNSCIKFFSFWQYSLESKIQVYVVCCILKVMLND